MPRPEVGGRIKPEVLFTFIFVLRGFGFSFVTFHTRHRDRVWNKSEWLRRRDRINSIKPVRRSSKLFSDSTVMQQWLKSPYGWVVPYCRLPLSLRQRSQKAKSLASYCAPAFKHEMLCVGLLFVFQSEICWRKKFFGLETLLLSDVNRNLHTSCISAQSEGLKVPTSLLINR